MKLHCGLLSLIVGTYLFSCTQAVWAQPIIPTDPDDEARALWIAQVNATPEGAIYRFVELYNNSQWDSLPDLIQGAERDRAALAGLTTEISRARGTLQLQITDMQVEVGAGAAIATFSVRANDHIGLGMVWRETLKLQPEPGNNGQGVWKLRPSAPASIDSVFDSYLQRLITLIAYPKSTYFLHQRESANQVKQLALGVLQFVQDYDSKYDFTPANVQKKIQPYIKNDRLWTAPGDPAGTQSYSVNPYLSGLTEEALPRRAETVLFYLGHDEKLDFRYGGKTVVGFTDGHVEFLDEEGAKKLRWKP